MKRKSGFTLVELLVVIGIIALLISILLPALGRVRWQAQTTACAARMRDVTNSVIMYANDNKGWLPPYRGDDGKSTFNAYFQDEWNFGWTSGAAAIIAKNDPGAQLGRLWRMNYIKTTKVFYCPSTKGEIPTVPTSRDFQYYAFNPHFKYVGDPAGILVVQPWWKRLANYGKVRASTYKQYSGTTAAMPDMPTWNRAILMDSIWNFTSANDKSNVTHLYGQRRSYNMAYPDGHVATYTEGSFTSRQTEDLLRFLDFSNALQSAADGNSVIWTSSWQNKNFNAVPVNPN